MRTVVPPSSAQLESARNVIRSLLPITPLIGGPRGYLKLETLQPAGSFKVRGALHALSAIPDHLEVVAASAGNHALGIAYASRVLNRKATVVIAENASPAKRAFLEQQPVHLIRHGQSVVEAEHWAMNYVNAQPETRVYVSPYNDPLVIAGQATVLDEVVQQLPDQALTLLVPTGGGGLLAGIALRAAELVRAGADLEVIGVESSESRAVSAGVAAGHTLEVPVGETIADGLAGNIEQGSVTVDIIRREAVRMEHVPDNAIHNAMRWLVAERGLVAEGAGATALALLLTEPDISPGRTPVVVVSGKNISRSTLIQILAEGTE